MKQAREIVEFLGQLDYAKDERNPPDSLRRGRFKAGWHAATDRGKNYTDNALKSLTWDTGVGKNGA